MTDAPESLEAVAPLRDEMGRVRVFFLALAAGSPDSIRRAAREGYNLLLDQRHRFLVK